VPAGTQLGCPPLHSLLLLLLLARWWQGSLGAPPTRRPLPWPLPDKRYQRHDKRDKLPAWITQHLKDSHLNLSTDMLLCIAREFMRSMAQPYDRAAVGRSLLSEAAVNALDTARPPANHDAPAAMQLDG
jgi:hypothetical protein